MTPLKNSRTVKVLAHSKHYQTGSEVATVLFAGFPYRCIQEIATHRMLRPMAKPLYDCYLEPINPFGEEVSRNSASSRAIPTLKVISQIEVDPYIPEWRAAKKGMQGGELLPDLDRQLLTEQWLEYKDKATKMALWAFETGACKQDVCAYLLPFMRVDIIATATADSWQHFIDLRAHEDAHPDFAWFAYKLKNELARSQPNGVGFLGWHMPFTDDLPDGTSLSDKLAVSSVRAARISYGNEKLFLPFPIKEAIAKRAALIDNKHMSPLEHQVQAVVPNNTDYKNLAAGWRSQRALVESLAAPKACMMSVS